MKDKRSSSIVNAFQKKSQNKENQINYGMIRVVNFTIFFKGFLKINNTEMYSTYYEGKSFVVEIFIRTLKNKIFKHMAAVLDDFVNKYNTS